MSLRLLAEDVSLRQHQNLGDVTRLVWSKHRKATGVHVVACTGYICEEHGLMSEEVSDLSIDEIADIMIQRGYRRHG